MNRRLLETFLTVESGIGEQAVLLLPKSQQASVPNLLPNLYNDKLVSEPHPAGVGPPL